MVVLLQKYLDNHSPTEVKIVDEFEKLEILKQICNQKKIPIKYSKLNYLKFKNAQKIKLNIRNKAMHTLAKKRFNERVKFKNFKVTRRIRIICR